jgi:predicted nucleic acid-binding protein
MEKINIFIDTNILLSLYDASSNNLSIFKQLLELMEDEIQVLLPEQVKNEFYRNRENRLSIIFSNLPLIPKAFPNVIKDNEEFEEISQEIATVASSYQKIVRSIKESASKEELLADKVIKEVFDKAIWLNVDDKIIKRAKRRYDVGNPPGKKGSYGDAIIWETLLSKIEKGQDIFFASNDNDYSSQLDKNKINSYLGTEWENKMKSTIFFFKDLDKLLKDEQFKNELDKRETKNSEEISKLLEDIDLKIIDEENRNNLINNLKQSNSFAETHGLINSLRKHSNWTYRQKEALAEALVLNSQVNAIIEDDDVFEFYNNLKLVNTVFDFENIDLIFESIKLIDEAAQRRADK